MLNILEIALECYSREKFTFSRSTTSCGEKFSENVSREFYSPSFGIMINLWSSVLNCWGKDRSKKVHFRCNFFEIEPTFKSDFMTFPASFVFILSFLIFCVYKKTPISFYGGGYQRVMKWSVLVNECETWCNDSTGSFCRLATDLLKRPFLCCLFSFLVAFDQFISWLWQSPLKEKSKPSKKTKSFFLLFCFSELVCVSYLCWVVKWCVK